MLYQENCRMAENFLFENIKYKINKIKKSLINFHQLYVKNFAPDFPERDLSDFFQDEKSVHMLVNLIQICFNIYKELDNNNSENMFEYFFYAACLIIIKLECPYKCKRFKIKMIDSNKDPRKIYEIEKFIFNKVFFMIETSTPMELTGIIIWEGTKNIDDFSEIMKILGDWINYTVEEYRLYKKYDLFTLTVASIMQGLHVNGKINLIGKVEEFVIPLIDDLEEFMKCIDDIIEMINEDDDVAPATIEEVTDFNAMNTQISCGNSNESKISSTYSNIIDNNIIIITNFDNNCNNYNILNSNCLSPRNNFPNQNYLSPFKQTDSNKYNITNEVNENTVITKVSESDVLSNSTGKENINLFNQVQDQYESCKMASTKSNSSFESEFSMLKKKRRIKKKFINVNKTDKKFIINDKQPKVSEFMKNRKIKKIIKKEKVNNDSLNKNLFKI